MKINAKSIQGGPVPVAKLVNLAWMLVMFTWPILKWVVVIDVMWQGLANGAVACLVHFSGLCGLTYFVAFGGPDDL
jgi:hypothetical protein